MLQYAQFKKNPYDRSCEKLFTDLLQIYIIVLTWVLIPHPLANHNPAISSVTQALKILTTPPRQTKSPYNSTTLNMFNNDTYTNIKAAFKTQAGPDTCQK